MMVALMGTVIINIYIYIIRVISFKHNYTKIVIVIGGYGFL